MKAHAIKYRLFYLFNSLFPSSLIIYFIGIYTEQLDWILFKTVCMGAHIFHVFSLYIIIRYGKDIRRF